MSAAPDLRAYRRIVVAFSGGKDSLAALLHLLDPGVPPEAIELHHHDVDGNGPTFMDWPCTPAYVRAIAVAGYAATRSENLVLQLRIMLDAISHDGRLRIDPKAMVRLCATGNAILADVDGFGLPSDAIHRSGGGSAPAIGSPGAG